MTKDELLTQLANSLETYKDCNYIFHKEFIKELVNIATSVSYQDVFLSQLVAYYVMFVSTNTEYTLSTAMSI